MKNLDDVVSDKTERPLSLQGKFFDLPCVSFDEVVVSFRELLHLTTEEPVRVLLAAFVANRFSDSDPVWTFFISPPGTAKTEFIMALEKVPGTYCFSELTPRTLISGIAGASLLHRVGNNTIFLQKDFTTILNMRPDDRAAVLSQFREVFDGKYGREVGKGKIENWEGKMGFISGCTQEIEKTLMMNAKFGDRFIYYRMPKNDDKPSMRKARQNAFRSSAKIRSEMQRKVAAFIGSLSIPAVPPEISDVVYEALSSLCLLAVKMRTPVDREEYSSAKDITNVADHEGPMRMLKEIVTLAGALVVLRGEWSDDDYPILAKIILDSVPSRRLRPVLTLYSSPAPMTTKDLEIAMQLPARTIKYVCEELAAIGIVTKLLVPRSENVNTGDDYNKTYLWTLSAETRELMAFRSSVDGTGAVLAAVSSVQERIPVEDMTF